MDDALADLKLSCAARVAALVGALRSIPPDLAPVKRAATVAVREQIYFGWEVPLARAAAQPLVFGKYERNGWWSEAAGALVISGGAVRGQRLLERDHVEPVSLIVNDLLGASRTAEEVAALLEARLLTCTVLAAEHKALAKSVGEGWGRYEAAGIAVRLGID